MKRMRIKEFIIILSIFAIFGCDSEKKELSISAAASLTEVMTEIKPIFEEKSGVELTVNLASSGTLQKQIEEGAPVDVFLSASKGKMDALEAKDLIDKSTRKDLLKNQLVLIVPKNNPFKISSLKDLYQEKIKISIGEPNSVPVGKYAKESLEYYKLWDKLQDKLVYAKNVKQVLSYVESGEIDAGIVYYSDATVLKNSIVVEKISFESHGSIVYPIAVIKDSKNLKTAQEFIKFLDSEEAKLIIKKYNFSFFKE